MTACKTDEAKEIYLRSIMENHYSKRELERQIDSMLYERIAISDAKYGQLAKRNEGLSALRDAYILEFLDLPASYKEKDSRKQIVSPLKDLILEFGRNFSFIGEEYRLQVGNTDSFGNDLKVKGQAQELSPAPNLKRGYRQLLAAEVIKSR